MRRMTAIIALMAVSTLAVCFVLIGAVSVEIRERLGIDNSQIGTLASALFFTSMVVQLFVGVLVDKLGHKLLVIFGFLMVGISILLLAFTQTFALALVSCSMLGLGGMCVCTVGNTLLPIVLFEGKEPVRASNLGNGFFGLAFVLTSWAIGYLLHNLSISYTVALCALAVVILAFAVLAMTASYPKTASGYSLSMAVKLLVQGPVWLASAALFCYVAIENTMTTWIKPLITDIHGGSEVPSAVAMGGIVLGLFGLAIAVGRFISSTIKNLTEIGAKLVALLSLVSILALLALIFSQNLIVAVGAVIIIGLAFAPMFPTIVGLTFAKYDPSLYGSIFGIIFTVGLSGAAIVPKLIGQVSMGSGIQQSMLIVAGITGLLLVISLFMGKPQQGRKTP